MKLDDMASYDPYDIWAKNIWLLARKAFLKNRFLGATCIFPLALADWWFPCLARKTFRVQKSMAPITLAHLVMASVLKGEASEAFVLQALDAICKMAIKKDGYYGWGLSFNWLDRRAFYKYDVPLITHTPYVMEALLEIIRINISEEVNNKAYKLFHGTWGMLEALPRLYQDQKVMAVAYSPLQTERMIVVNANAYAAFSYALHAKYGKDDVKNIARCMAKKLINWIVLQQRSDGSWTYLSNEEKDNFIDCFHSCFIIKNLIKTSMILSDSNVDDLVGKPIEKGMEYICQFFFDAKQGLCQRFTMRKSFKDPYKWDLYDQAEFLGLLVDFGELKWAEEFAERVEKRFRKGNHWYCRIDIFGRRWGKNFLRWGIAPFWYHRARLRRALEEREACAA